MAKTKSVTAALFCLCLATASRAEEAALSKLTAVRGIATMEEDTAAVEGVWPSTTERPPVST